MKFIPVKTFDSYITANIWLGRLQEENIVCYLQDEFSVTINPALTNAVGGIKLCVTDAQVDRCRTLISQFEKENKVKCPRCFSDAIVSATQQVPQTNFFQKLFSELFGRDNTATDINHCRSCGNDFTAEDNESSLHQAICSKIS